MKKILPFVSIITVNYNGKRFLKDCLDSLLALNYPKNRLEIIMIDNCSRDDSVDFVKGKYPRVKIIKNNVNNYCKANNLGIAKSKGEYIALLNNDTKVDRNWLAELIKGISKDNKIGAAGSKILFEDGRIQSVGHVEFPYHCWGDMGFLEKNEHQYSKIKQVYSVSNCAALYRRKAFDEVGLFDEDFVMYMEDVEMAFRFKQKGWKIFYVPDSIVYHKLYGSGQSMEERQFYVERNRLLFIAKYFPEKLPELMFGSGEILRLKKAHFHALSIAVFNKLIKHHSSKAAIDIFSQLNKTIDKIEAYGDHSSRIELERKQEVISAKDRHITDLTVEIRARDEQIKTHQEAIAAKDKHITDLMAEIKVRDEQIKAQDEQIKTHQETIVAKDKHITDLTAEIKVRDEQIKAQDEQIKTHQETIVAKDKHITDLTAEIEIRDNQIVNLNDELSKIYDSETYRFIVRPILWPFLSFVKKIKRPFNILSNKIRLVFTNFGNKKRGVCIAQLYAKSVEAKYMQENEYIIKLVNNRFKEEKVKLVVDIWPHRDRYHPQRHFAYFSTEIPLKARDSVMVKLFYDWEKNVTILMGDGKRQLADFWRGPMKRFELYTLEALIYSIDDKRTDSLNILQRLKQ